MNQSEEVRIGVYICHCGVNIAGTVDVSAVAEYASGLDGVAVARDYMFMCSDPGQDLIQKDIKEKNLNRVVVSSCSPHLHEHTFRRVTKESGLNPFYCQMANIREHVSWVTKDREKATAKAKALVRATVGRIAHHDSLEIREVPINPNLLVVGGGIAGMQAALAYANSGKKVYLVEREPSIGGHMAKLDETFPTLDCSSCILTPKMSEVGAHSNIELLDYAEVESVEGHIGSFEVTIRRKPRYVDAKLCTGCNNCIEACVYKESKFPNEFDLGLSKRKPIYIPFPQATPLSAVIDSDTCLNFTASCSRECQKACDRGAIDFDQEEKLVTLDVGGIILATGFETFDPEKIPQYSYGRFDNVLTSLELERQLDASGPTDGDVLLRDGSNPKKVGIIHCVGSRDQQHNPYCSRVCCMYSLKHAHQIREKTGAEVYNFFIDLRAFGKDYEEFYRRVRKEGLRLIRGLPSEVLQDEDGKLHLIGENIFLGEMYDIDVDMVILAVGLEPQQDVQEISELFNISTSADGFFAERHPKLAPVSTLTEGIFLAGACQGPKDIPDTVSQAGDAASQALALADIGRVELEAYIAEIDEETCSGCMICLALCPFDSIQFNEAKGICEVEAALCKGCGVCSAACPSGSASQNHYSDVQLFAEIEGLLG